MLSPEQTEILRQQLQSERKRLVESAQSALSFAKERDRDRVGRDSLDESTDEAMYATQLRLHDREKFLLAKIDAALQRMERGEFGMCEDCDDPIGFQRLKARPVTTLCIQCKSERELAEGV